MPNINIHKLELAIQQKLNTPDLSSLELLTLTKALEKIKINPIFSTVATFAELPSAVDNVYNLYYVTADKMLYYSYNGAWTAITASLMPVEVFTGGQLWSWGYNNKGELGSGNTTNTSSPGTVVGGGTTWAAIDSCLIAHMASIKTDGTLWTWGANYKGGLGDGTTTSRSSPGTTAGGGTTWSKVATGASYSTAIKTDGTLWTWGDNSVGQLGTGNITNRSSPGTVAGGGTTWYSIGTTLNTVFAVKTDGTLWTWGTNYSGQLGDGTTVNKSSPVTTAGGGTTWLQACGTDGNTTLGLKSDGTLWTWGSNSYGALGDGSSTTVSRSSPGTVAGGGTTWSRIAGGRFACAAIKTDGTLWTWGYNVDGQLGDGTTTSRSSPGTVAGGGTTWSKVSVGYKAMAAIKTDGTLWTWGSNYGGHLGTGGISTASRSSPGTVAGGGTTWIDVSMRRRSTLAKKSA